MYIGDLARLTGLSVDTLRWYEKIGLIPAPLRDRGGRRVYGEDVLAWIDFLGRLKTTGMSIADMRLYARLRAAGPKTVAARCDLLERHRAVVAAEIAALEAALAVLDGKITTYRATATAEAAGAAAREGDVP